MITDDLQGDLFRVPQFDVLPALLTENGHPATIIVGCGRRKKRSESSARELYTSNRFEMGCSIAETLGARYFILSGLHGLVEPDRVLKPYDLDIDTLDAIERKKWGERVVTKLHEAGVVGQICILSEAAYSDPVVDIIVSTTSSLIVRTPLAVVEEHHHEAWHDQALTASRRVRDLRRLYKLIEKERREGNVFLLGDLSKQKLPARGVYIFLDPSEKNFLGNSPRIVRIGTHAVSEGSKTVLKTRLRNHMGLTDGSGSHRGSIFRLHVGRAMLDKEDNRDMLQNWGEGQNASAAIRSKERDHELRVSSYLRQLEVFVIDIGDEPSKHSMRAVVERQLIALCSHGLNTIDQPSKNWLGLWSPMELIVKSGLWNLRDVGRDYEPDAQGSVSDICSQGV